MIELKVGDACRWIDSSGYDCGEHTLVHIHGENAWIVDEDDEHFVTDVCELFVTEERSVIDDISKIIRAYRNDEGLDIARAIFEAGYRMKKYKDHR